MRRELTKMIAFVVFTSLAGVVLASCGGGMCARNSDCKAGEVCTVDGVCAMRTDDGNDDSSTTDAAVEATDASETTAIDAE